MSTTLIIVELLIVGCQTLVWVALLLRRFNPSLVPIEELRRPELLATVLIATAYTLGVVGDRVVGHLSTRTQVLCGYGDPCDPDVIAAREFYLTEVFKPSAHDYFETSSRQIRLLRATGFNSVVTALVLLLYWKHRKKAWLLPVLLVLLGVASFVTWYLTDRTQKARYFELYRACQVHAPPEPAPKAPSYAP